MLIDSLIILLTIIVIVWGADRLTEGAVALATRMNIPDIIIGLTIVAFGTSAPEFFVSFLSALKGTANMAVGNIVGSNIFNALFILGCTALVLPFGVTRSTVKKDVPFAVVASIVLVALCYDNELSRWDAVVLLVILSIFMYNTFRAAKQGKLSESTPEVHTMSIWKALLCLFLGLVCLIVGSHFFVDAATSVARTLGMSDAVIGLTIVAGGTSLPELATSIVAARKGNSAIAIGNVIGSNILNILVILGITGVISPMSHLALLPLDYTMLLLSIGLIWLFSYSRYRFERWEGGVTLVLYFVYIALLIAYTDGYRNPWLGLP